ncbi:MAG TPA: AAA family ATPase [Polyangia bacterium]|nr:AAA family ATPase [Polyangia bacterium]
MSTASCVECGAPLQEQANFCATCGQAVRTGQGQRRHLTLLFCDLVGWTSLCERRDPEDLHRLATAYRRVCREAIKTYQGHISEFLGDGVMSYFGYPRANEDDAVLATRAGLRIVHELAVLNRTVGCELGAELHVRVGLNSGEAIFGGDGGRERFAIGEPVNLAARIQQVAEVDTVVISESTARLIQGYFDLRPLGPQRLKGYDRQVAAFQVVRPTGARSRFEAAARHKLTPHVGRQAELAALADQWTRVERGTSVALLVRGESGIGKSRLLHQLRQTGLNEQTLVLDCFCSPLTQATAFAPVIDMLHEQLRHWAPSAGDGGPAEQLQVLASLLVEQSQADADALPLIAALLGIEGADDAPIRDLSPVRRRARTMEILREWMAWVAQFRPLALLVEDLHWADPSTLDFLTMLVERPPDGRTLVCMTARPEFPVPWDLKAVGIVELARLSPGEVDQMVTHVAGGLALPSAVARQIADRSEGVPLFVEEVTKAVLESGALRKDAAGYQLAGPLDDRQLPATVKESLIARFDRLGDALPLAQLGAAIGREFSYALIRAVAGLPDDELAGKLQRLSSSELVFVDGTPPAATYMFKHALIQETLYGTVLRCERRAMHERIFTTLAAAFPELVAARPEMAAYHAEQANRPEAAIPLLQRAGIRALDRKAVAEAVKHLAHGVSLLDVLQEPERTSAEIEFQAALGPAYMATRGWAAPEVQTSSARLRDLAAARGDGPRLFQAIWSLWTVEFLRARLGPALRVAQQVLNRANATGDPMLRTVGHHAVGYTHFYRGEYDAALRHAEEGLALFDLQRELALGAIFQFCSSVALLCFRTEALQVLGRPDEATRSLGEWRAMLALLRHAPSRAYSLTQQCFYFHGHGDHQTVRQLAEQAHAISLAEGYELWVPITETFLAWADAKQGRNAGDAAAAVERIKVAKQRIDSSLTHIIEVELVSMHAETLLLAGRPGEVDGVVVPALELAAQNSMGHYVPELFRLQGEAARAQGDWHRAAGLYHAAVEASRLVGARGLETRALQALQSGPAQA